MSRGPTGAGPSGGAATASAAWRLPLLWLFVGPPILRLSARTAEASLHGSVGVANLFRVAWWVVFGVLALYGITRHRRELPRFARELPGLHLFVTLYIASMYVSLVASPVRLFTLVSAVMMTILVLAAADLALKLRAGTTTMADVLARVHLVSAVLVLAILAGLAVAPSHMSKASVDGLRLTGGGIGDPALLGLVLTFVGLHLARRATPWLQSWYLLSAAVGVFVVILARNRTEYIALVAAAVLFLIQWLVGARPRAATLTLGMLSLLVGTVTFAVGATSMMQHNSYLGRVSTYVVRNPQTVATLSGRTAIAGLLIPAALRAPFGLGYAAGPRTLILDSGPELIRYGVVASHIGNAHDAYLEVFAGLGPLGTIGFLGTLLALLVRMWRVPDRDMAPVRALLLVILLHSVTGSEPTLPFETASAILWLVAAMTAGTRLHRANVVPP